MPQEITVGSHIWVEDQELAWVDGVVTSVNGDEAEVETSNGNQVRQIYVSMDLNNPIFQIFSS